MEEYENNRSEWTKLYDYYFIKEENYLKISSILEYISIGTALLNAILSFLIRGVLYPVEMIFLLSVITLISSILFSIITYISTIKRKQGELGRRTSFFNGLVPFSQLESIILQLERKIDRKFKIAKPNWYIVNEDDIVKTFCLNFLESAYYQSRIMIHFKEKMIKTFLISVLLFVTYVISIFIVIINTLSLEIIVLSITTIIVIIPVLMDRIMKIIKFKDKEGKFGDIYDQLYKICRIKKPKPSWLIFEALRLFQEYSVYLQNIIPIPDKFFKKNKYHIKKDINQIINALEEDF